MKEKTFNRYQIRIVKAKITKRTKMLKVLKSTEKKQIGFRLRAFFKSSDGEKIQYESKVVKMEDIKSKIFRTTGKWIFKSEYYTDEFKKEIADKNKAFCEIKEIEVSA